MRAALQALAVAAALWFTLPANADTDAPGDVRSLVDPSLWQDWKDRFLRDGRVIDNGNGGISHSEGQGYGMLLAALAGDRPAFAGMLDWTVAHLGVRDDALFAWRFDPASGTGTVDANNATDGDILIAWALAEAAARFRDGDYRSLGALIARAIASRTLTDGDSGPLLLPGVSGFSAEDRADGPVVNLSYWVYPAFPVLAGMAPEYDWALVAESGLALSDASRFGSHRLPPDWLATGGAGPTPAAGFPSEFGWNAIRIPLYLAWGFPGDRERLAPFADLWGREARDRPPSVIDLDDRLPPKPLGAGYEAIPALVACAVEGRRIDAAVRTAPLDLYYPSTLRLLVLAAAAERYPQCL